LYKEFKLEKFDDSEHYEIKRTTKYNKEKLKKLYQERKTNNGNVSPPY
jgi:hypothetical protein